MTLQPGDLLPITRPTGPAAGTYQLPAAALAELLNPPPVLGISGVVWSTVRSAADNSWQGLAGEQIAQGDLLLFDGTSWSTNAALGPDGAGVIRIQVAAPLSVDESDPAQPLLSVEPATTAAAGVLRLAAAEDLTAGTEGAAVDAAALKEAMATAQPAGDYMPLDLSTLPALP